MTLPALLTTISCRPPAEGCCKLYDDCHFYENGDDDGYHNRHHDCYHPCHHNFHHHHQGHRENWGRSENEGESGRRGIERNCGQNQRNLGAILIINSLL